MVLIKDILRTMDYGPSPEGSEHVRAWLDEHRSGFGHFINGAFTKPGDMFDVFNPATGERIARATQGSPSDIDAADDPKVRRDAVLGRASHRQNDLARSLAQASHRWSNWFNGAIHA